MVSGFLEALTPAVLSDFLFNFYAKKQLKIYDPVLGLVDKVLQLAALLYVVNLVRACVFMLHRCAKWLTERGYRFMTSGRGRAPTLRVATLPSPLSVRPSTKIATGGLF